MKQEVLAGQVDYTVLVLIRDDAGAPKTGLTEASIDIAYARVETDNDVTTTDVTPAALSALTDAHTDWGFEEVSSGDHPGLYRLDLADAVFATGAWSAVVTVVGTGLDPTSIEFVMVPHTPLTGVLLAPTTHTSAVIPTVSAVTTVNGFAANSITAAAIANGAIDAATFAADVDAEILSYIVDDATRIDASALNTAAVTSVPAILVDTNELQTDWVNGGRLDLILDIIAADTTTDIPALIATLQAFVDTEVAAILTDTNELQTDWVNGGRLDLLIDAIKAKTDSLTYTVAGQVDANVQSINDVTITGDGQVGTEFGV